MKYHDSSPEIRFWNNSGVVRMFSHYSPPPALRHFLQELRNRRTTRVLDLGCGGGRNTVLMAKMGFDVFACDISSSMVKATRKRLSKMWSFWIRKTRIIEAAMENLPYEDGFFDVVVANGIFHNTLSLVEFGKAIREASRVLRKNGLLYLNVFYRGKTIRLFKKVEGKRYLYKTPQGLRMILLPVKAIYRVLDRAQLKKRGKMELYSTRVSTGERDCLRGVFRKR